jgi:hypothetical protein
MNVLFRWRAALRRIARERVSTQVLDSPNHTDNLDIGVSFIVSGLQTKASSEKSNSPPFDAYQCL